MNDKKVASRDERNQFEMFIRQDSMNKSKGNYKANIQVANTEKNQNNRNINSTHSDSNFRLNKNQHYSFKNERQTKRDSIWEQKRINKYQQNSKDNNPLYNTSRIIRKQISSYTPISNNESSK